MACAPWTCTTHERRPIGSSKITSDRSPARSDCRCRTSPSSRYTICSRRDRAHCGRRQRADLGETCAVGERVFDQVRSIALALPGVSERVSHGEPCFFVSTTRALCYYHDNHNGDGRI